MTLLSLARLTVRRGPCPVVDDVSLSVAEGELVGLIGPNGAGKTTLLRAAIGLLPHHGDSDLARMPARSRAARVAWMPQTREIAWPVSVETLVALGRLPHGRAGGADDRRAIDGAIARMGLEPLRDRKATELSGGEQARVLIARALAQETPLLLADEPVAGLDPAAQIATLRVFRELAQDGRAAVVALHDLTLAARYCHRLVLLHDGRKIADGPPAEVLDAANLARAFRLRARMIPTPDGPVVQALDVLP